MLKTILFTHDDLDGGGCRIIFEIVHSHMIKGDDYDVINCSNQSIEDDVNTKMNSGYIDLNTHICFADICVCDKTLSDLKDKGYNIMIWDHHRSNLFASWIIPEAIIEIENDFGVPQCGTSLMYQYFAKLGYYGDDRGKHLMPEITQKTLGKLVDTIRSYDTYEWKQTNNLEAKKLNTLFYLMGINNFCERYVSRIIKNEITTCSDILLVDNDLKFVIDEKIRREQKIINCITPDDICELNVKGYKVAFSFPVIGASVSELGNQFLIKYPEYDIFMGFHVNNNDGISVSFRSIKEDVDVSKIASMIGGGGHIKAAGASLNNYLKDIIINTIESLY